MAQQKHTWVDGELITSDNLNNIEDKLIDTTEDVTFDKGLIVGGEIKVSKITTTSGAYTVTTEYMGEY